MTKYQRLQDLREDKDMRQEDVANYLQITRQQYQLYESGKREIKFSQIIELAKLYNVSIDYISGLTNDKRGLAKSQLSDIETTLLKGFNKLNDVDKGIVLGTVKTLLNKK